MFLYEKLLLVFILHDGMKKQKTLFIFYKIIRNKI